MLQLTHVWYKESKNMCAARVTCMVTHNTRRRTRVSRRGVVPWGVLQAPDDLVEQHGSREAQSVVGELHEAQPEDLGAPNAKDGVEKRGLLLGPLGWSPLARVRGQEVPLVLIPAIIEQPSEVK